MRNIESILKAAGSGLEKVVQMTIYVSDIALWGEVNTTYARIMGSHKPARAIVPVKELHHGYQIEIQAVATT
jgi:2-iminobutanoate/2-iminopropanoate deaminase